MQAANQTDECVGGQLVPGDRGGIELVAAPDAFSVGTVHRRVAAGPTIADLVLSALPARHRGALWEALGAHVWIDDWYCPCDAWRALRP
jgi:hypothetical protein